MPLYFFHTHGPDGDVRDDEGMDLPDMEALQAEALCAVREMVADSVRTGKGARLRDRLQVEDEAGRVVYTLAFDTVLDR